LRNRYDAFWFPSWVRNEIITSETEYDYLHFRDGMIVADGKGDDTVTVRWPRLDLATWRWLLSTLRGHRGRIRMDHWHKRLPHAVKQMRSLWADRDNLLRQDVLAGLSACTGYSPAMLDYALTLFDMVSVEDLQLAATCELEHAIKDEFVSINGLAGKIRFFEEGSLLGRRGKSLLKLDSYRNKPWRMRQEFPDLMFGFAAGGVPGTGLLLALLGLAAAASQEEGPPVIVIRNSQREPLFTPLVLSALELVDPALLDVTVVTLWDSADSVLQGYMVAQSDLIVASAGDETLGEMGRMVKMVSSRTHPIRYHPHHNKIGFSTVGRESLEAGRETPLNGVPLLDAVALLASLDAVLWHRQGCPSSWIHFVEVGDDPQEGALQTYAEAVAKSLRSLSGLMPKGVSEVGQTLLEEYLVLAAGGEVQVLSAEDDCFFVALDRRALIADQFRKVVEQCPGGAVVIIPVNDVLEIPQRYLSHLPRGQLQSMSVAVGDPAHPGTDPRLLEYADALGAVGIGSIRTVGRGAFPQLAYSWDGLIPLDLTVERPKGHFTALEFDQPWPQIYETYRLVEQAIGL